MTERAAIRSSFSRAATRYASAAGLQRVVCDRLLELLPDRSARLVLDLGCGTGFASAGLQARFPQATHCAVDFSLGMLRAHEQGDGVARVCADAHRLPLASASADVVLSSLMLQWCDLPVALAECRRVLHDGGHMCFSTVLHGTLAEIDEAFAGLDAYRHTVSFPAPEVLAAALTDNGFAVDLMRCEAHVEYFADARGLLQSNRDIGASHVPDGARRALLGRAALRQVCNRLEARREARGVPLTYQLAWVVARASSGDRS
ncbi:malonyl-ACP O-methyltransferase BioC [Methyloversatilis discipulorum]|uniref:malonyl-ACP O-methyltransferase BioC n=1 Tax=Methyloversatilis discipulorum TaxID=1119528 RepID=UPI0003678398|nr:malonyl-ACP O-methyltransferase BioC [Methyloversatilis discipulorum]